MIALGLSDECGLYCQIDFGLFGSDLFFGWLFFVFPLLIFWTHFFCSAIEQFLLSFLLSSIEYRFFGVLFLICGLLGFIVGVLLGWGFLFDCRGLFSVLFLVYFFLGWGWYSVTCK